MISRPNGLLYLIFCVFERPAVCMLIGFFFLGIEELAIQLEEPFSVLPLSKIVAGIGLSAEEHVQWMEKTMLKNQRLDDMPQGVVLEPSRDSISEQKIETVEEQPVASKNRFKSIVNKVAKRARRKQLRA